MGGGTAGLQAGPRQGGFGPNRPTSPAPEGPAATPVSTVSAEPAAAAQDTPPARTPGEGQYRPPGSTRQAAVAMEQLPSLASDGTSGSQAQCDRESRRLQSCVVGSSAFEPEVARHLGESVQEAITKRKEKQRHSPVQRQQCCQAPPLVSVSLCSGPEFRCTSHLTLGHCLEDGSLGRRLEPTALGERGTRRGPPWRWDCSKTDTPKRHLKRESHGNT